MKIYLTGISDVPKKSLGFTSSVFAYNVKKLYTFFIVPKNLLWTSFNPSKAIEDVNPETVELHRPYVDDIHLKCDCCGKSMTRVTEVIDFSNSEDSYELLFL